MVCGCKRRVSDTNYQGYTTRVLRGLVTHDLHVVFPRFFHVSNETWTLPIHLKRACAENPVSQEVNYRCVTSHNQPDSFGSARCWNTDRVLWGSIAYDLHVIFPLLEICHDAWEHAGDSLARFRRFSTLPQSLVRCSTMLYYLCASPSLVLPFTCVSHQLAHEFQIFPEWVHARNAAGKVESLPSHLSPLCQSASACHHQGAPGFLRFFACKTGWGHLPLHPSPLVCHGPRWTGVEHLWVWVWVFGGGGGVQFRFNTFNVQYLKRCIDGLTSNRVARWNDQGTWKCADPVPLTLAQCKPQCMAAHYTCSCS